MATLRTPMLWCIRQGRLGARGLQNFPCSRAVSSSASPGTVAASSPAALERLKRHRPKIIPDYLAPMHSHLLTTTLSDLLQMASDSSAKVASPPLVLPQGHHLVYFPIQTPPSELVGDGADPDHSPGRPFTRRVWAGGEVVFGPTWRALRLDGREAVCRESIEDAVATGRAGDEKVFVDVCRRYGVGHDVEDKTEWEIQETRRLVFMPPKEVSETSPPPPLRIVKAPHPPAFQTTLLPTPVHLFHFSALTFNAHAIHLDPVFARADGHRAPLVHGPLTLALMLRVLNDRLGPGSDSCVRRLSYRNLAPLYVDEPLTVCLRPVVEGRWDVWVEGPEGGLAVRGSAVMGSVGDLEA